MNGHKLLKADDAQGAHIAVVIVGVDVVDDIVVVVAVVVVVVVVVVVT